jgi:ABC-type sugar transport system ATPase subunit
MTDTTNCIEARGLVKRYPGVLALDRVDLSIAPGSVLGLVGKNGAGKSSLIKVLAGVVQPDEGELLVDGEPKHLHGPRDAKALGFAFVHQELADVPNLTVAENVQLGLGYPRRLGTFVNRRELRRRTQEALDRLEAHIHPDAPVASLSIAQRRLVMIAHALAANARLVVLDEPTASLTDEEIEHLHDLLRRLRDDGVASVYVSHRLDEIFSVTDRVAVMRDGHTVFTGATADVTKGQLISEITGSAAPLERRRRRAGRKDAEELLRVQGLTSPGKVEDASFVLRAGDILGIAGLIGAGRTELVRVIFGADHAATGRILVRGKEVEIRSPRDAMDAGIALLPEDRRHEGAVVDFSVRKNMTLPVMSRYRIAPAVPLPNEGRERKAARGLVERLKIKVADVEAPVRNLSGGNQQKVVLAKWLECGADVFIFDEPTHGIDVEGKVEVYDLMDELADAGKGVIFISSEFTELVGTCNRVVVMREGRLVDELEGEAVTDAALVERCYHHEEADRAA